jgi:hypothetical protein
MQTKIFTEFHKFAETRLRNVLTVQLLGYCPCLTNSVLRDCTYHNYVHLNTGNSSHDLFDQLTCVLQNCIWFSVMLIVFVCVNMLLYGRNISNLRRNLAHYNMQKFNNMPSTNR